MMTRFVWADKISRSRLLEISQVVGSYFVGPNQVGCVGRLVGKEEPT